MRLGESGDGMEKYDKQSDKKSRFEPLGHVFVHCVFWLCNCRPNLRRGCELAKLWHLWLFLYVQWRYKLSPILFLWSLNQRWRLLLRQYHALEGGISLFPQLQMDWAVTPTDPNSHEWCALLLQENHFFLLQWEGRSSFSFSRYQANCLFHATLLLLTRTI